jgi:hypothetical protein
MMKKSLIALALAVASIGAFADGLKPLAYPGSAWSVVTFPAGVAGAEEHNTTLSGKVEQGIVWQKFGANKEWALNTYASFGYSVDREGLGYNNKVVPAIGVKMTRTFSNGVVDVGVQAVHENRFKDHQRGSGVQAYVSVWSGWDLRK